MAQACGARLLSVTLVLQIVGGLVEQLLRRVLPEAQPLLGRLHLAATANTPT